jgi:hypothetical protein
MMRISEEVGDTAPIASDDSSSVIACAGATGKPLATLTVESPR